MSGYIGYRKVPTLSNGGGIWTLGEQAKYKKDGVWAHPDAYWSNVSLLLPMTGANNSTTFTDKSSSNRTVTVYGDAKISTAQSKWGEGSGYFDGNGDFLQISFPLSLHSGACTIETFFKLVGTPTGNLYNNSYYILGAGPSSMNSGCDFALGSTAIWFNQSDYTSRTLSGTWTPDTQWHHIAVTRSGNNWYLFLDGSQIDTKSSSVGFVESTNMVIGRCEPVGGEATGYFYGYMQDFRITSAARYTSNFTPPATPVNY